MEKRIAGILKVENGYVINYDNHYISKTVVFNTLEEVVDFVARYFYQEVKKITTTITYGEWD